MKHPHEANLALYTGGDLGLLARWRIGRHLSRCETCRREVAALARAREAAAALGELPPVHWNRLAAEMKANIRLGLAAGECVREARGARPAPRFVFGGVRALAVLGSVVVLVVAGLVIERPLPQPGVTQAEGVIAEATGNGIRVKDGARAFGLLHARRVQDVTYTVGAQGSLRARYVDPDTGYVTINNVYTQ